MPQAFQYRRLLALAGLVVLAFLGLGYRLVDVQLLRHEELRAIARDNTERTVTREPRRGEIRDVRGNLLATSLPVKTVCADPTLLNGRQAVMARLLAPLLRTNETFLLERLTPRIARYGTNGTPVYDKYVVLKHKVRVEEWEQIRGALSSENFGFEPEKHTKRSEKNQVASLLRVLQQKAIFTEEDQQRVYQNQALAAHVLGFVGAGENGVMTGMEGIERQFNAKLSGSKGWRKIEKDSHGREVITMRAQDVAAQDGLNVVLTIDAGVQHIVETELAEAMKKHTPISASAMVVRPRTGEILAMATLPNFDPNNAGAFPPDFRRNRVVTDTSEPGSTFKIVVVSGALNEHIVTLEEQFNCENGLFYYAGKPLHDHDGGYGVLSVENIIAKSSNIGSAKIGIKMGGPTLYHYISQFGFGRRTGIALPGEVSGILHPVKNWNNLSISRIPMGHEVGVTPLQMIMAMAAIANDGRLMQPMIVDHLEDNQGHTVVKYQPQFIQAAVAPEAARLLTRALKIVVSDQGTAVKAKLDLYAVAGKTGTAQKPPYTPGKFFSSFIGFFPADNPELCISVVLDEPKNGHFGGQTCAPFFHNIAERAANYLNIRPEIERELTPPDARPGKLAPRIVAGAAPARF